MSDIKNIKDRVTSSRTVFVAENGKGQGIIIATGEILSLITTIESQNSQIESLKAITELAVKGLQKVCDRYAGEYEQRIIAKNTLDEIERLQNETT